MVHMKSLIGWIDLPRLLKELPGFLSSSICQIDLSRMDEYMSVLHVQ